MKKIGLFLGASHSYGGTFQYSQALLGSVSTLPKDKFSVVVVYTVEAWVKHLEAYDVKKVPVRKGFWGRAFCFGLLVLGMPVSVWRQICRHVHPVALTLLEEQCDLWIFPCSDGWSYLVPVPALVTIHDLMHRYEPRFPEVSEKGERRRREREFSNICKWAKGILVDSEVGRRQVMESYGLDASRIHVLPYIPPKYIYSHDASEDFDSLCTLPKKYIFYPAQFWEHKNHERLIRAVGRLKREIPDLKLVLSGSKKNAYDSIRNLVRDLNLTDDIFFLGYVPDRDMLELYRRARALVIPTFFGPTNIPPLEAFIVGCPVAVSGIYGMPEQVGDAALLFDPKSVAEIAECIRKLWTDDELCTVLAAKGRQKAALWGEKQFNEKLRNVIERILSQHQID